MPRIEDHVIPFNCIIVFMLCFCLLACFMCIFYAIYTGWLLVSRSLEELRYWEMNWKVFYLYISMMVDGRQFNFTFNRIGVRYSSLVRKKKLKKLFVTDSERKTGWGIYWRRSRRHLYERHLPLNIFNIFNITRECMDIGYILQSHWINYRLCNWRSLFKKKNFFSIEQLFLHRYNDAFELKAYVGCCIVVDVWKLFVHAWIITRYR